MLRAEAGGDIKKFQTGLHKSLTEFIRNQYGLDTIGKSTEDIIAAFEGIDAPGATKSKIASWLTRADKEKFSPTEAAPGEVLR